MAAGPIGRGRALAAVDAFVADSSTGSAALLIEGAAGIGKTAVWRAAVQSATAQGCIVLQAAAEQAEARMSLVGLVDLLDGCYDAIAGELPAPQRGALDRALLRAVPERPVAGDARATGTALRSAIVALARERRVVIAVDDLQWLDAATAAALAFAARRLDGHHVGFLLAARTPPAVPDRLGLRRALGDRRYSRITLGSLSAVALQEIVERRLGYAYRAPVAHRLAQACDGNPLFALEIARALGPEPELAPGRPLPVTEEFEALVAARVAQLSRPGRHALLAASALSHPTVELVQRASSERGLAAALRAGLIELRRERVQFAHPLYASAVYLAAADARRRRELHRTLAAQVADPVEQARHLALSTARSDARIAATLEHAAEQARARGDWSSTADLLEHALRLTPARDREAAARRALSAAEHHVRAGDQPRARGLLEDLLRARPPRGVRSDARRLLARISYHEHSFSEAAQLLDAALTDADDPAAEVSIGLVAAYVGCHHLGDFASADQHAAGALAVAEQLGDDGLLAEALAVKQMVDYLNGRGVDWTAIARAEALEHESWTIPLELRPSWIAVLLRVFSGELERTGPELLAIREQAERSGDESAAAQVLCWLTWVQAMRGDPGSAITFGQEAVVQASLAGSEQSRGWAFAQLTWVHAMRGDVATTRACAASAEAICEAIGTQLPLMWVAAGVGLLELSLDAPDAAWAALEPLIVPVEQFGVGEAFTVFIPTAIEALIGTGRLQRARRLLDDFERRSLALDRVWGRALGGRCRGQLLAQEGDLDGAQHALAAAVEQHHRQPMPFELGRTLLVQGQVRRRARSRRLARESLQQAVQRLESAGAEGWAAVARSELGRIAAKRPAGELTEAERRTARLAADGLANKQIASRLFVSVHTVEVHLSHAYAKLGVRSRVQLAALRWLLAV